MLDVVYLSRRNLLALLSKLDRKAAGEDTMCTILKMKGSATEYQQTVDMLNVVAIEDEVYYTAQGRSAGMMHPDDEAKITKPSTGIL